MINTIIIAGRVVADPSINFTKNETIILNFTIVNNRKYKNKEQTTFIDVTLFWCLCTIFAKPYKERNLYQCSWRANPRKMGK